MIHAGMGKKRKQKETIRMDIMHMLVPKYKDTKGWTLHSPDPLRPVSAREQRTQVHAARDEVGGHDDAQAELAHRVQRVHAFHLAARACQDFHISRVPPAALHPAYLHPAPSHTA